MKTTDIKRAAEVLSRGGTVVFPTETLYGLAAMATNKKAVEKVYAIKRRPREKLLPVIVGSFAQAQKYFIFSREELTLARRFWPGPLTLVLKARSKKLVAAVGGDRVAVRYSANAVAARLAISAGAPITSTSANISGKQGCFTIASVKRQLGRVLGNRAYPDMFLNGGTLKRSLPSTIIRVVHGRVAVIREGKISTEELKSI
jgi:L-threonylcarbamoyladenylate synthase